MIASVNIRKGYLKFLKSARTWKGYWNIGLLSCLCIAYRRFVDFKWRDLPSLLMLRPSPKLPWLRHFVMVRLRNHYRVLRSPLRIYGIYLDTISAAIVVAMSLFQSFKVFFAVETDDYLGNLDNSPRAAILLDIRTFSKSSLVVGDSLMCSLSLLEHLWLLWWDFHQPPITSFWKCSHHIIESRPMERNQGWWDYHHFQQQKILNTYKIRAVAIIYHALSMRNDPQK